MKSKISISIYPRVCVCGGVSPNSCSEVTSRSLNASKHHPLENNQSSVPQLGTLEVSSPLFFESANSTSQESPACGLTQMPGSFHAHSCLFLDYLGARWASSVDMPWAIISRHQSTPCCVTRDEELLSLPLRSSSGILLFKFNFTIHYYSRCLHHHWVWLMCPVFPCTYFAIPAEY